MRLVTRACGNPAVTREVASKSLVVVAAGKAAGPMAAAFVAQNGPAIREALAVGAIRSPSLAEPLEWFAGGHPEPNEASILAGSRALRLADALRPDEVLVVLLSGGASAMLCAPAAGLTLTDKQATARVLMHAGADIHSLNIVRKHLSAIKGGRLAAAAAGATLALAISDVVNDDFSSIGSGPASADPSTFAETLAIVQRYRVEDTLPSRVMRQLRRGAAGMIDDTPKPGAAALRRTVNVLAGSRVDALEGARQEAAARGYDVAMLEDPITGEARVAGAGHLDRIGPLLAGLGRPACVLSGGETTVTVRGRGQGGRNQEWALATARTVSSLGECAASASVGTDGVDGPTDAAGALVDTTTLDRARRAGLSPPESYLENNDSHAFFRVLDDLIVTGPTDTNVGDIQIVAVS